MHFIQLTSRLICISALLLSQDLARGQNVNSLTPKQKEKGWTLLFDGKTTEGWRGFKKPGFPEKGWVVEGGTLMHQPKGGGGDIMTTRTFSDYVFAFEFKLAPRANSGIKYFITEKRGGPIGHEYQVLDDETHPDGKAGLKRHTASFYDVLPVGSNKVLKPIGEWNKGKIKVQGKKVEHWLNGKKVLTYELGSEALKEAVAGSKFKNVDGFGTKYDHHILLQDHGDQVWYRNLKIRELK